MKNKLKFFILPTMQGMGLGVSSLLGTGLALGGNVVTTLYMKSIEFEGSLKIEYDDFTKRPKMIERPGDITISFLEDERGTVWRYLQTWRKSIAYVTPPKGNFLSSSLQTMFSSEVEYVFADNQEASERIGILILQSGIKMGYKFPRIMFYGMKLKEISNLSLGYDENENLTYSVSFSVREIAAPLV